MASYMFYEEKSKMRNSAFVLLFESRQQKYLRILYTIQYTMRAMRTILIICTVRIARMVRTIHKKRTNVLVTRAMCSIWKRSMIRTIRTTRAKRTAAID